MQHATQIARRDVTPSFIVAELITYLNEYKVERPGYTTLQTVISQALVTERERLAQLLCAALDGPTKASLAELLVRDDTLSELAALKQDARDFGWTQMERERDKRDRLQALYLAAKALLPKLEISQQNLHHYSSLANFYTVYDLRRMKPEQANLYLLCYVWQRYRQFTDNLVDALGHHTKQVEDKSKVLARQAFVEQQLKRQNESPRLGRLLLLYVDDAVPDTTPFGTVRQRAYKIMPRDELKGAGERLSAKASSQLALRWEAVDTLAARVRRNLRPLFEALDPASIESDNRWLAALTWIKSVFAKKQRLSQRPVDECPARTVPKRLRPYLLTFDADGKPTGVQSDRFEFWIYRQIRKRLKTGELFVDDSHQHRHLSAELVSAERQALAFEHLDIPWVRRPLDEQLAELTAELHTQWLAFDRELRADELTHLDYDEATATLTCRRPQAENDDAPDAFYEQLPFCDVADVLRFVNRECVFLSALTPLQPRYAKQVADEDSLLAVIAAQAMNHGTWRMSRTSDIPYHVLETAYQQYLRLATLQVAIVPTAITGDMHSLNKLNFAILQWFGPRYEPRSTDLDKQLREIYCAGDPAQYAHCLVKPAGQIDLKSVADEKPNIDRIVATLGLKEMTQGMLVRKLCTYDADPTRKAIFEYDRLVRSAYPPASPISRRVSTTQSTPWHQWEGQP